MTLPTSPTNQWGGYYSSNTPVNFADGTTPSNPPATGLLVPAQSPSGSVTGQSATWNYNNTETSTQNYVSGLNQVDGVPMAPQDATNPPAPPGYNIAQTTPRAPVGSFVQQGQPALNAAQSFTASWMQGNVFKWQ
jgi:hypothetical protein